MSDQQGGGRGVAASGRRPARRERREPNGFWISLAATVVYPLGWLLGRGRYGGGHHLPGRGGALVVANHVSHLDPVYSALLVHRARRVPRFLAKHSLWRVPVLSAVLRGGAQIPVYRGSGQAQQSLRAAIDALREGKVVVIYPEGTITRDPDGWPMHARTGVARLALAAEVPVLPMAHWGTREVLDLYRKRFRPLPRTTVTVQLGEPIDLTAYRERRPDAALLREVTDLLMGRVRDLLAEVRDETAPTRFYRRGGSA